MHDGDCSVVAARQQAHLRQVLMEVSVVHQGRSQHRRQASKPVGVACSIRVAAEVDATLRVSVLVGHRSKL